MIRKKLTRSIAFSIVALTLILLVNFFLPRLMPGDPLAFLIGSDEGISEEEYNEYYHAMGLDKPIGEQFADYLDNLFHGRLGYSYHHGRDVGEVLKEKLPRTLLIAFPAWIISALIALLLGIYAGYRRRGLFDRLTSGAMVVADTAPTFLMAMLLLIVFAYELNWLPFGALNSAIAPEGALSAFADRLRHLVLPVLTIVLASTPKKYLLMRSAAAKAADEKYIVYARARGLSTPAVLFRHVFPNVGQPFIAMLGTGFGKILSGSIVVEMIFSIDGMGMLVSRAITDMDYPVLQAAFMIIALSVIASNLIADLICLLIGPRQGGAESL